MLMPCPGLVAGQLSRWQKWTAFQNELGSWPVRDPTGHAWTFWLTLVGLWLLLTAG